MWQLQTEFAYFTWEAISLETRVEEDIKGGQKLDIVYTPSIIKVTFT